MATAFLGQALELLRNGPRIVQRQMLAVAGRPSVLNVTASRILLRGNHLGYVARARLSNAP